MRKLSLLALILLSQLAWSAPDPGAPVVESEFEEAEDGDYQYEPVEEVVPVLKKNPLKADVTPAAPEKPSSSSGKKLFDWSKHKNEKEVAHPLAEKGLTRVTSDGTYLYKVDESNQKRASHFRIGIYNPTNLENPEQSGEVGSTFEENYDQTDNPAIMFDYEWQKWRTPIGKWGITAGGGLYVAQGNGHFKDSSSGLTPREIFTFWTMPFQVGAVYRAQFYDRQLFVPYAQGGGIVFAFGEFRDDNAPPKWGGALGAYFAGGLALNLSYFDALARAQLDREYGINRVYLTAEFRQIISITQKYDFTSDLINAGFLMEF